MPVRSSRLALAGVIAVTVIAVPAAALASGPGAPSGKPAPSAAAGKPAAGSAAGSAAGEKSASPAGAAPSKSAAARSARGSGTIDPRMVTALATQLGVGRVAAQRVLSQLDGLGRGGVDPASPAFAAIARGLGVSPARLAAALDAAKQAVAGQ